jgi:hypothetical protein
MGGFIATPSMVDITRLSQAVEDLQRRVAILEGRLSKPTEVGVPAKAVSRTRGTRLPEPWIPNQETIDKMSKELHVSNEALAHEHRKFCDYFYSAPGQKGVKADWNRAWCNWMRTAAERGSLGGVQRIPARRTNDDKIAELMGRNVARAE